MRILAGELVDDLAMTAIPILLNNQFLVEDRRVAYESLLVSVVSQC
ncbi:hypothetical protein [Haloferax sp. Q22]|nr:hypothetical protein [Haloferax sp. Q22]